MTTGNPFSNPFKIDPAQLKFEVARARAAAGAKGFRDLVEAAEEPYANESVSKLPVIDLAELQGYPPSREYCWGNLIQLGITTMLTGKGGVGKSLLALNLCASVAAGRTFLGLETVAMKALFLTVEDDRDEVWRRLTSHVLWHGSSIEGLQGRLLISTLCGEVETALAVLAERGGVMEVTYRWRQLRAAVLASGARLVVLDNATDMMAGDLNDIHQVAEFVNLLTSLAIEIKGAVVILHHPNKAGDEWLGSVAWHNKVRSRLVVEDGGVAGDPDARVLINPKANYGQQGGRVAFRWHEGTLVSEADMSDGARAQLAETAQAGGDNNLFMACLAERTRQHRAVSDKRSPTFAPAVFAEMPEAKGIGKRRLEAAMERLFRLGRIERAELWKGDDRKPVFGLRELAGNGAADTVRNTRATQVSAAEKGAGNAGNTHTTPKGVMGVAPLGAAAIDDADQDWPDLGGEDG